MATWSQVKEALTAQGIKFDDFGEGILTGFTDEETGRSQSLILMHVEPAEGFDAITFQSPVGPFDSSKAYSLLKAASELPFGLSVTTVEQGEFFVVHAGFPLADLDASELEFFMQGIAMIADGLEQEFFGGDDF